MGKISRRGFMATGAAISGAAAGFMSGSRAEEKTTAQQHQEPQPWPVLRTYDPEHIMRVAMPMGGIGTGTVSLGGRGNLQDWEIMNQPAKGFDAGRNFFAVRVQAEDGEPQAKLLEGPVHPWYYEGSSGARAANHGLPRFRNASFKAAYPLGKVRLSDEKMPVEVRLEAFNPMIPTDAEASGIPVAILRYAFRNTGDTPVSASMCGVLTNFMGTAGGEEEPISRTNEPRLIAHGGWGRGIFMSPGGDPCAPNYGTLALVALDVSKVSATPYWRPRGANQDLDRFWRDFFEDGQLTQPESEKAEPGNAAPLYGALAAPFTVPPQGEHAVTWLIAWHFPNRMSWTPPADAEAAEGACCSANPSWVGNHYTTVYKDAWDVVERTAPKLHTLEEKTVNFVEAFCSSDLPEVVKEAALFNTSTLRSQTCFRTAKGHFYGWEGCNDNSGCCFGSCTHVWNYEQATAFLFGALSRSLREGEFLHRTDDQGMMPFREQLPLGNALGYGKAAADGQMGCLLKLYRDWQLSGDEEWLRKLWPNARKALAFAWIEGGWDADEDGVMEGCQHNTMDVEYFGPNPQMQFWYLGALRAAEEIARHLGEQDFAERCRKLYDNGSRYADEKLFNGEYYVHLIQPMPKDKVHPALTMGANNPENPVSQLGPGCLVDQLVGQFLAHVCGLGHLGDPAKIKKTHESILQHNWREDLFEHANNMRTYALNDESALLMCTWPNGGKPEIPFPYHNEVMTGFEYTAAIGMLYEGMKDEGLRCIQAIRDRYDGYKRSPFNEAECGHHYARAMAAWAAVLALTGFQYSGVEQAITFNAAPGKWFWSNGYAWGLCEIAEAGGGAMEATLTVLHGELPLRKLVLSGLGTHELDQAEVLDANASRAFRISKEEMQA